MVAMSDFQQLRVPEPLCLPVLAVKKKMHGSPVSQRLGVFLFQLCCTVPALAILTDHVQHADSVAESCSYHLNQEEADKKVW
jgi:hypothetical protein